MANSQEYLITPDGYTLSSGNNSITSMWFDKRSCSSVGISFILTGVNAPTGTVVVQTSNSPATAGNMGGSPQSTADAMTFPGSSVAITATGITRWDLVTPDRWVRVVYTASANVSGLSVNCWANAPRESA